MKKTSELFFGLATLFLMAGVLWHMLYVVNSAPTVVPVNITTPEVENIVSKQNEFKLTLEKIVSENSGQAKEGYEPIMYVLALPGLELKDFDQVEAMIGHYEFENGELKHEVSTNEELHNSATSITENGMNTLLVNISNRLHINLNIASVNEIIQTLKARPTKNIKSEPPVTLSPTPTPAPTPIKPPVPTEPEYPVACTMEARMCPDGSYVGRTGPNCEFSACPATTEKPIIECAPGSNLNAEGECVLEPQM